jgi:hypothetical protein
LILPGNAALGFVYVSTLKQAPIMLNAPPSLDRILYKAPYRP